MPKQGTFVVARGMPVEIGMVVRTWQDHGWRFMGRNRAYCRAIVCHWTAAENPAGVMYRNMMNHSVYNEKTKTRDAQPLSIHFAVSQKGLVYQLADTELRCVHAGDANAWSIGIEFIGRGSDLKRPQKGFLRERVTERIQGQKVSYDELLPAQIEAGVKLIEALCHLYQLPIVVPEDGTGAVKLERLDDKTLDRYRGVIGHMHCHPVKYDPGAALLRAVQARGKEIAGKLPVA